MRKRASVHPVSGAVAVMNVCATSGCTGTGTGVAAKSVMLVSPLSRTISTMVSLGDAVACQGQEAKRPKLTHVKDHRDAIVV